MLFILSFCQLLFGDKEKRMHLCSVKIKQPIKQK